jgi:hypothetical protein
VEGVEVEVEEGGGAESLGGFGTDINEFAVTSEGAGEEVVDFDIVE